MLQFLRKAYIWLSDNLNPQTRKITGNTLNDEGATIRIGPGSSVVDLNLKGNFSKGESFTITRSKDSNPLCVECSVDDTGKVLTFVISGDGAGYFGLQPGKFSFDGKIDANFKIIRHPGGFIIQGTVKVSSGGSFNFNRDYLTGCGCTYDSSKLQTSGGVTFN